jgi:uncharacterized protein (DUF58 family)
MTGAATGKLRVYATLAAAGLIAALGLGRPELAALAAPFAVFAVVGLVLARRPVLSALVEVDRERQIEGRHLQVTLELKATDAVGRLEVLLELPEGLMAEDANPRTIRLGAGEWRTLELRLRCVHWGAYELGNILWRARDPFGLLVFEGATGTSQPLKVYPRTETLQRVLRPLETQAFAGHQVARSRGEGIEFADLRPFATGDRVRRVNWRATARRGTPWVNEYHPERNSDIVLFLDTFAEARRGGPGTLDLAVGAAGSLAERYLRHKDRVGLVSFGGVLNWLLPATGVVQLYRVVDALLDTEIVLNYAWKDLDVIPLRTLPPKALVIALTPLIDKRSVAALLDLRRRGFDLAVVEIDPSPYVEPGKDELELLAFRLWRLRREALRSEYERVGVPVVPWQEGESLQVALEEVRSFRRGARAVRA